MKRIFRNIIIASILTLVAYLLLYTLWFALLSEFDPTIAIFILAFITTCGFSFILLYISKIQNNNIEDEIESDYRYQKYTSIIDDFKLIISREIETLICITAIVMICFALNTFDSIVFEKKVISFPTIIFAPMCLFDTAIELPFVGYAVSSILDCVSYITFLLFYRRKKCKTKN